MHSKSDDTEIMVNDRGDEIVEELFDSLKTRYQNNLESIRGSELSWIMFNYCIVNVIKKSKSWWIVYKSYQR